MWLFRKKKKVVIKRQIRLHQVLWGPEEEKQQGNDVTWWELNKPITCTALQGGRPFLGYFVIFFFWNPPYVKRSNKCTQACNSAFIMWNFNPEVLQTLSREKLKAGRATVGRKTHNLNVNYTLRRECKRFYKRPHPTASLLIDMLLLFPLKRKPNQHKKVSNQATSDPPPPESLVRESSRFGNVTTFDLTCLLVLSRLMIELELAIKKRFHVWSVYI